MTRFLSLITAALFFFTTPATAASYYQHFYFMALDAEVHEVWIPPRRDTAHFRIDQGDFILDCELTILDQATRASISCEGGLRGGGATHFRSNSSSIVALSECEDSPRIIYWQQLQRSTVQNAASFEAYMRRYENPTRCGG